MRFVAKCPKRQQCPVLENWINTKPMKKKKTIAGMFRVQHLMCGGNCWGMLCFVVSYTNEIRLKSSTTCLVDSVLLYGGRLAYCCYFVCHQTAKLICNMCFNVEYS